MPLERPDLRLLLERVRHGDEDAARELLKHFEPHVRRVVRRRLPLVLRSKFDSMDFVQSVWGDFFAQLSRGEIDFETSRQLAKFLAFVAQAKVADEVHRRLGTEKFGVLKEVALRPHDIPAKGRDPTPSQHVMAHERLEAILSGRPKLHREVLQLRSEGCTFKEIASRLEIDERTARRILHGVERDWGLNDVGQ